MTARDTAPAAEAAPTRFAPPEPAGATLADHVYRRITADIVAGRLAPGSKLAFHWLKAEYGVSVSTAREALQRLAGEQMVESEGHRGFRVAMLSLTDLQDINALRMLLEPRALHDSITRGDDAWEERVVLASHRLARMHRPENLREVDADAWEQCHRGFHEALISACSSRWLQQFCRTLWDQSSRYRRLIIPQYSREAQLKTEIDQEHKDLVTAALARDADKAVAVLVNHYENTARRVMAQYPQDNEGVKREPPR